MWVIVCHGNVTAWSCGMRAVCHCESWFAWPHGHIMWVIVGHYFCIAHNDSRGKVTNFVFSVCGSTWVIVTALLSRAQNGGLHHTYNIQTKS